MLKEITNQQELIVPCPYCNQEAIVKLEPYKREKKEVHRGNGDVAQAPDYEYQFPDVIPTEKPE